MAADFKGLEIKLGADTKEFEKEMKKVNGQINNTTKQVDLLVKGLALEFDSKRFAEAQRLAQSALAQTENKVQTLRDRLAALNEKGVDPNSSSYQMMQRELLKTENSAILLKNRLEEINNLKLDLVAKKIEKVGSTLSSVGQKLAPVSAAAAAAIAGISAVGLSAVKTGDDIATMAAQLNLNAESLQRWQYIAMQTDVSNEQLQNAFTKTQSALADLATGQSSPAATALQQLGLTTEQAALGMEHNLQGIVESLSNLESQTQQAALANELFGDRLGSKLLPLLQAGGDGLKGLADEFETFSYLTNDQVQNLGQFDNVLNRIKYAFGAIKNQLGASLLPLMESLSEIISTKIIPFVQRLSDRLSELTLGQQKTMLVVAALVAALAPVLIIVGKITSSVGGLVRSIGGLGKAFSVLAAHPALLALGVLIGLLATLYSSNEEFRESINSLVETLGKSLQPAVDLLVNLFQGLMTILRPVISAFGDILTPIITALVNVLNPLVTILSKHLLPIFEFIGKWVGIISTAIGALIQLLSEGLGSALTALANLIKDVIGGIPTFFQNVVKFVENAINSMIGLINNLIDRINGIGQAIGLTIPKIKDVEFNITSHQTSSVQPPSKTAETITSGVKAQQIVAATPNVASAIVTNNNDYSSKQITISPGAVVINNYAADIDSLELAEAVNRKLAELL